MRGPVDVALPDGTAVRLLAGGLATSSNAKRRWLRAGMWQHHLIDPQTGRPCDSPWRDVTVCAATCLQADVAVKAAFILGEEGLAFLEHRGLAGLFVRDGGAAVDVAWAA